MISTYTKVGSEIFKRPDNFFRFPGGEWHLKDDGETYVGEEAAVVTGTDVNDYVKLALWQNACKKYPNMVIPYLPAARADRGTPLGAAVYANLIPNYRKLVVFDAHSDFMVDYLKATHGPNVVNVQASDFFDKSVDSGYDGVIAPDEGAINRAARVAGKLGIPVFYAKKTRNFETGELSGFEAPEGLEKYKRYLIVDDICDGGGTFIGLADAIYRSINYGSYYPEILDLYVSHGIFSKGLGELNVRFKKIITTDSLPQHTNRDLITIKPVLNTLLRKSYEV